MVGMFVSGFVRMRRAIFHDTGMILLYTQKKTGSGELSVFHWQGVLFLGGLLLGGLVFLAAADDIIEDVFELIDGISARLD